MLKVIKNTIIDGQSIVEDVVIAGYHAEISNENPNAVQIQSWQYDIDKCLEYRELVNSERQEFENAVHEVRNSLLAELEQE